MSIREKLLKGMALIAQSGVPVFDISDLSLMAGTTDRKKLSVVLFRACQKGVMQKVASGIYISLLTPPSPDKAIYQIASKLRKNKVNYISLESQLSYCGVMSQIPIDRLTMMTTGRKGVFRTPYGVIEFTHTKKKPVVIFKGVYLDDELGVFRASTPLAISDLKVVGRNVDLMELSE